MTWARPVKKSKESWITAAPVDNTVKSEGLSTGGAGLLQRRLPVIHAIPRSMKKRMI